MKHVRGHWARWGALWAVVLSGCQCGEKVSNDTPQPPEGGEEVEVAPAQALPSIPDGAGVSRPNEGMDLAQKDCLDLDGDGYGEGADCHGLDCDDADPTATEASIRSCYSGDPDTRGVGACADGTQACLGGTWGECHAEALPSSELCDGADNDCDGEVDDEVFQACYPGPAGTLGVGACLAGAQACQNGAWGACAGQVTPQLEHCDAVDNDCNGTVDENLSRYTRNGSSQAVLPVYQPVDIVFVIDNSSSMSDEIRAVEANINTHFAEIIAQSGLDYRVIMISQHGSGGGAVCIRSPLSGNGDCSAPAPCPTNGSRFFHYNVNVGSFDSLSKIVGTYDQADGCGLASGGWSGWLRPEAKKVFMEFTDDEPRTDRTGNNSWTAAMFEAALFAIDPAMFGTPADRNYVFHSIVGLKENAPPDAPWLPADPLVSQLCTGNGGLVRTPGTEYQKLSIASGGLRYPLCEYQDFDAIFRSVATGIVVGSQLDCAFTVSSIPADSTLDNAYLELTPTGSGVAQRLTHVANEAACSGNGFYTDGTSIVLCPDSCNAWRQDPTASIDVVFTCSNQVQP